MGVSTRITRRNYSDYTIEEVFDVFKREKLAYGITQDTITNYHDSLMRFCQTMKLNDPRVNQIGKSEILDFIYKLKDEELKKLLVQPVTDDYCEWRSWAVVNWILATANREKTVCSIRMCDLNIPEKEIILPHLKNKKAQIIPMSSELAIVLKIFIREFRSDAKDNDYLFCNIAGERLSENALKLSVRKYNKSRDVERTSIHALRHTFAKYWIRNNGDVFRLQRLLGHSSLDMTRVYVNLFSEDLKEGFDNFSPLDRMSKKTSVKHKIRRK